MNIALSESASITFFYIIFIISACLAEIGGYSKKYYNFLIGSAFIFMSFLLLIIPLAFRKVGIDHDVYREWFDHADFWLRTNYHLTPEPLFAALTLFAKNVLNDFQFIYIVSAFVFLIGIYKFLLKNNSLGFISILFFNVSIYLYMCGLVRISLAIGILTIAYINLDKTRKFIILLLVAILFHYTAIIGLLVLFSYRSKKSIAIKNIIYIFAGIFIFSYLVNRFSTILPYMIMRYAGYVRITFNLHNITNCIIIIPVLFLWKLYGKSYFKLYGKQFEFYDNLVKIMIVLIVISMMYNGLFRFTFYFYPFVAKIYHDFSKILIRNGQSLASFIYKMIFMLVGIVYAYNVFFDSPYITSALIPFNM